MYDGAFVDSYHPVHKEVDFFDLDKKKREFLREDAALSHRMRNGDLKEAFKHALDLNPRAPLIFGTKKHDPGVIFVSKADSDFISGMKEPVEG